MLDDASFHALRTPPRPKGGPVQLRADLTADDLRSSAVARNALVLLRAAGSGPGLKLTGTGNLVRRHVLEMIDLFEWPQFDKAEEFRLNKVVNEPDFLPLHFVRRLSVAARLLRKEKGHLKVTPLGRRLLGEGTLSALHARLLYIVFWTLEIGCFGRHLHGDWPLQDCGVVLWCLSVAAADWETRERLTRLCTVPTVGVIATEWDSGSLAMEARVLRPLCWFGMLDCARDPTDRPLGEVTYLYRKTRLFDRALVFDVGLELTDDPRH